MEPGDVVPAPAADIERLTVTLPVPGGSLTAVKDLSLTVAPGETLGIVGESGSGKSMTALALMGLLPASAGIEAARMQVGDTDLLALSDVRMATEIRGRRIGMIFQEPMTSLNPVYPVGRQLLEVVTLHGGTRTEAKARALELLEAVGLPDPAARFGQYPHQFSGGQRQRIMIAMALMNAPEVLIADEPTTALDVTIQAQILDLLRDLQKRLGIAIILITHDFGVVANHTDRVMVMLKGEVVETGSTQKVLHDPHHDYTKRLMASLPHPRKNPLPPPGPLLIEVSDVRRRYSFRKRIFGKKNDIDAIDGISLTLSQGEVLAIVGESGSGKSTLSRLILGLEVPDAGIVQMEGQAVGAIPSALRAQAVQPIFQDPYGSLNPRMSISAIIRRPLDIHGIGTRTERGERVRAVMEQTGLSPRFFNAFPNQMSGGQRQRVAIARALVMRPRILICDEPTSALDVSIQAQILTLLDRLREELDLTILLITHDLAVVRQLAGRVIVMQSGRIVEEAPVEELFTAPQDAYTRALLASVPRLGIEVPF